MIRSFKVLGLLVVAALAMSAAIASSASAEVTFTCSSYECKATGSNTLGNEKFTTEAGTVECDSHFVVEEKGTEIGTGIQAASKEVTVTASYTGCVAFGFLGASVSMEGCDYLFTATEKVALNVYKHHVNVVCPAGKSIKIVAGTCEALVGAQTGLTTAKSTNLAGGTVTVQPEVANIALTVTKDGIGCPFSGTGAKTGSYHGDVVISRIGGGNISVSGE